MDSNTQKSLQIYLVSATDSPEFTLLTRTLSRSSIIGLDAEWKPTRSQQSTSPTVSLLQLSCQLSDHLDNDLATADSSDSPVFLVDLLSIPLPSIWDLLKDVFTSPDILKLGFRFKQDMAYLSSTFCLQGCDRGFDTVEPYMDITSIHAFLQQKQLGRKTHKNTKSLASICEELLNVSLSKELQCSDWSQRPLTEEQKTYAARDAHCLVEIFNLFQTEIVDEGKCLNSDWNKLHLRVNLGLKHVLEEPEREDLILRMQFAEAFHIIQATNIPQISHIVAFGMITRSISGSSCRKTKPMDDFLFKIVRKYGEILSLKESDLRPKHSKRKSKKRSVTISATAKRVQGSFDEWQGPPPWDLSVGGDGYPKFLCDVMVEGLAKHLRCVGIDAAVPHSKRAEPRELIGQAQRENRVLLTRDAKLLRHDYLLNNQIYRVKTLLKNEQLLEVIETFGLQICEDKLMSRCTKCNGKFIQKPLTTDEAVEAAKGFQKIPDCLFNKNLEFWQCMDCNQLYWEGTQYHNAVQKFIDVCKLN